MSARPDAAPPGVEGGTRWGRLVLRALLIGLAAFAIGFLFTALVLFRGGPGDDVVTVPDLRERTEDDARRILARLDLAFELGPTLVNPEVPAGRILAQSPLPGEEVAPGSAVRVTVSGGAERRAVPDVRGLGREQARQTLSRFGFAVEVEERTDPAPAGRVLDVTPRAGTLVDMPGTVLLTVSAGPPLAEVPSVVGLPEEAARQALAAAGFGIVEPTYDAFSLEPPGTVLDQAPVGGAQARAGSGIRLTIAGPEPGNL